MQSLRPRGRYCRAAWRLFCLALVLACASSAPAQDSGQADLDEAMVQRIDAETVEDLEQVTTLLESAIAKGLDDENAAFAKKMLGAVALEKGQAIAQQIMRSGASGLRQLRREAIAALEKAVEADPTLAEANLLIARLSALPGGDKQRAYKAATAAIEQLADDGSQRSEAYVLRAMLQADDQEKQLEDLNKAIEADPTNEAAYQGRALLRMRAGETELALDDLRKLMELNPTNTAVALETVRALLELERFDEAMELLGEAIRQTPTGPLYRLRAALLQSQEKYDAAKEDLNKALSMDPRDFAALLQRSEIALAQDDLQAAKRDLKKALQIEPNSVQGIMLRSLVASGEGRLADAINDMLLLSQAQPENTGFALQLANLYQADKRPKQAIRVVDKILQQDPDNWQALRLRGDARLSIAQHAKAVEDYDRALEIGPDSDVGKSGVLNNLAWVLATSPHDSVRDAERAIKLAQEAAELTEHKEAHILSTLAAAYAEAGQFDKAVEWATKAVERGREEKNEQLEQLEKELESYRQEKPWREEQNIEENKVPLLAPEDIIDT